MGITTVSSVRFIQVYIIEGDLSEYEVKRICEGLLVDKVSQDYSINENNRQTGKQANRQNEYIIEIAYNPGVMEPV